MLSYRPIPWAAAVEMTLALANVPHKKGGAQAAMEDLVSAHARPAKQAAE